MTLKKPTQGKSLVRTSERPESGKALPAASVSAPEEPEGGLDRFDIAILAALQSDARMSNLELASQIGLSPAPTWRRVRRLETQG